MLIAIDRFRSCTGWEVRSISPSASSPSPGVAQQQACARRQRRVETDPTGHLWRGTEHAMDLCRPAQRTRRVRAPFHRGPRGRTPECGRCGLALAPTVLQDSAARLWTQDGGPNRVPSSSHLRTDASRRSFSARRKPCSRMMTGLGCFAGERSIGAGVCRPLRFRRPRCLRRARGWIPGSSLEPTRTRPIRTALLPRFHP